MYLNLDKLLRHGLRNYKIFHSLYICIMNESGKFNKIIIKCQTVKVKVWNSLKRISYSYQVYADVIFIIAFTVKNFLKKHT